MSAAREKDAASAPREQPVAALKDDRKIRARFSAGALHPLEALQLGEGEIVEIRVRKLVPPH
jgi:hypothetical protein